MGFPAQALVLNPLSFASFAFGSQGPRQLVARGLRGVQPLLQILHISDDPAGSCFAQRCHGIPARPLADGEFPLQPPDLVMQVKALLLPLHQGLLQMSRLARDKKTLKLTHLTEVQGLRDLRIRLENHLELLCDNLHHEVLFLDAEGIQRLVKEGHICRPVVQATLRIPSHPHLVPQGRHLPEVLGARGAELPLQRLGLVLHALQLVKQRLYETRPSGPRDACLGTVECAHGQGCQLLQPLPFQGLPGTQS
mmetsp:Transcript_168888/g.542881  ORF Transcript_168888/g.542881 Transcript_168888/m.542881 type:complete len:251 (+) Transcript_168888:2374-3126(+)